MLIRERWVVDTVLTEEATQAMYMRGTDGMQEGLFTLAKLDDFVPANHPLRAIRVLVNEALLGLNELSTSPTPTVAERP